MAKSEAKKMATETCKDCQPPQFRPDQHAPGYDNDVPNNWLRGNGMKPNFDKSKAKR